jgi:Fe-S cluster biogenesis protein NfuA
VSEDDVTMTSPLLQTQQSEGLICISEGQHNGLALKAGKPPITDEARLEQLVAQLDAVPDPAARELANECIHAVLELYGRGLARVLQLVQNAGESGPPILDALVHDKLLGSLLLIHGLHPVDIETRLGEALQKVRPYMQSHGGNVELLGIEGGVARLRFHGTCKTCPSSTVSMELAIRRAVEEACPDLNGLELESDNSAPQNK